MLLVEVELLGGVVVVDAGACEPAVVGTAVEATVVGLVVAGADDEAADSAEPAGSVAAVVSLSAHAARSSIEMMPRRHSARRMS